MANADRSTQSESRAETLVQEPVRMAHFGTTFDGRLGTASVEVAQPARVTERNIWSGIRAGFRQFFIEGTRLTRSDDVVTTAHARVDLPLGLSLQTSVDLTQEDVARAQRIAFASAQQTVEDARQGTTTARAAYDRVVAPTETHVDVAVTTLWGHLRMERGTNATMAHRIVEQVTRDTAERETVRRLTAVGSAVTTFTHDLTHPQLPSTEEAMRLAFEM